MDQSPSLNYNSLNFKLKRDNLFQAWENAQKELSLDFQYMVLPLYPSLSLSSARSRHIKSSGQVRSQADNW